MRHARLMLIGLLVVASGCTSPAEPAGETAEAPAWRVHRAEAAADHPAEAMLTRRANGADDAPTAPRLVIGCLDEVTSVYVEWGHDLGAGDVPVALQVGEGPEQTARWAASMDHEAAGLWADSTSVPFVRALLGHDVLRARVTAEDGTPLDAAFTLTGLDERVGVVDSLCAWPPRP